MGLALSNLLFSLPYSIQPGGSILPWTITYSSAAEAEIANNFSNMVMYLTALVGFAIVLFRAHYLHESHIPPRTVAKLNRMHLEWLLGDSFEVYHQALVWLAFLWLGTIVTFIYSLGGGSLSLGMLTFLFSFAATYLYTKDLEAEMEVGKIIYERN